MSARLSKARTRRSCGASLRTCGDRPQTTGAAFTPSYIHAVLRTVLLIAVVVACGPKSTDVKQPGGGGGGGTRVGTGSGSQATTGTTPVGSAPDVGCLAPTCAYHAGGNGYFTCLASGAGVCFHFGGPCTPKDTCMYDAAARTYKQCAKVVEGTCAQWGNACAPASACMFSPTDNLHHTCDEVSGGTCKRYGALCAP
jgi:hypothetical protein